MFVVMVNFISSDCAMKHVTIKLFEVDDKSDVPIVPKLQGLLDRFCLTLKILTFVKDEGTNLQTCARVKAH